MTYPRTWNAHEGRNSYTLMLQPWSVQFGGGGPGPYDSGSSTFSHAEFRDGRSHDDIKRHFGADVLQEALSLLVDPSSVRFGGAEGAKRDQLDAWSQVEVDESLAELAENGDDYGNRRFHLADAAPATTNEHSLSMNRHTATITGPEGRVVTISKQLSLTALLAHAGRFFLAANSHGYVFDTAGALITSTEHLVDYYGLGNDVRVNEVIRQGDDIAFGFSPFGGDLDPVVQLLGATGTFRLSDNGELTARGSHDRREAAQGAIRSRPSDPDQLGEAIRAHR